MNVRLLILLILAAFVIFIGLRSLKNKGGR